MKKMMMMLMNENNNNNNNKIPNFAEILTKEPQAVNSDYENTFANIDHLSLYKVELESLQNYLESLIKEQDRHTNQLQKLCDEVTRTKSLIKRKQNDILKLEQKNQNG